MSMYTKIKCIGGTREANCLSNVPTSLVPYPIFCVREEGRFSLDGTTKFKGRSVFFSEGENVERERREREREREGERDVWRILHSSGGYI